MEIKQLDGTEGDVLLEKMKNEIDSLIFWENDRNSCILEDCIQLSNEGVEQNKKVHYRSHWSIGEKLSVIQNASSENIKRIYSQMTRNEK